MSKPAPARIPSRRERRAQARDAKRPLFPLYNGGGVTHAGTKTPYAPLQTILAQVKKYNSERSDT
jgi:hypothetical protein